MRGYYFLVFKEPLAMIRLIQMGMAILAFSTTAGFSTKLAVSLVDQKESCTMFKIDSITCEPSFPFWKVCSKRIDCPPPSKIFEINAGYRILGSSTFFVGTGVVSLLYALGLAVVYGVNIKIYYGTLYFPLLDLAATALIAFTWLVGSVTWSIGVNRLADNLSIERIVSSNPLICDPDHAFECTLLSTPRYGLLYASLVLGFACFLLWCSSLWFVYKETFWHQKPEEAQAKQERPAPPRTLSSRSPSGNEEIELRDTV